MTRDRFAPRRRGRGFLVVLLLILLGAGIVGLWGALRRGPAPGIVIETSRPAIGRSVEVVARFKEPRRGLGAIRLELVQGDKSVVLGESSFQRAGAYSVGAGTPTGEATLQAKVGRDAQDWLKEGQATLRATADRMAGVLRSDDPVVVEKTLAVKLRPPRLELLSQQHYVRQGGAGTVVFRAGETATRSGVRAGEFESPPFPLPGGSGELFSVFAVPWDMARPDANEIRVFAEDDAGNRVELPFVTIFWPVPPKTDTIEVTPSFLEKVVPAITAATPELDTSGTLLEQYLRINGELRRKNLAEISALAAKSEPRWLLDGPFVQMRDTAKRANFAETRTYVHGGRVVDKQTHLGLDLASLSRAPVPAPNAGRVVFADWLGIYGNAVVIDHGFGLMSLCGHLSAIAVKPGDVVSKGQTVGNSGATGLAGGDHLHLEIFLHGKSVNPVEWFDAHWIKDNVATRVPFPGL